MSFIKFCFLMMLLVVFSTGVAFAQVSVQTEASVDVMATISLTEDQPLKFGQVILGTADGEVTLSTANVRTATEDIVLYGNANQTAKYSVAGIPGATYAVTLPASSVNVSFGEVTLVIKSFKALIASVGAESNTGTLDASTGRDNFTVGAVLELPVGATAGHYSGTFDVGVAYN
jgi:hypothetical protein